MSHVQGHCGPGETMGAASSSKELCQELPEAEPHRLEELNASK